MSYGIYINNINGETQVDGEYSNFSLFETHSQQIGAYDTNGIKVFSFTDAGELPLLAVKPTSTQYKALIPKSSSDCYAVSSDVTEPIVYMVFTKAKSSEKIPTGSYGINIYNSSGNVVFHNNKKWLRIFSTNIISPPSAGNYTDVTVVDADNNYFILTPQFWNMLCPAPNGPILFYAGFIKKINTTTIRYYNYIYYAFGTYDYEYKSGIYASQINIIEVNAN